MGFIYLFIIETTIGFWTGRSAGMRFLTYLTVVESILGTFLNNFWWILWCHTRYKNFFFLFFECRLHFRFLSHFYRSYNQSHLNIFYQSIENRYIIKYFLKWEQFSRRNPTSKLIVYNSRYGEERFLNNPIKMFFRPNKWIVSWSLEPTHEHEHCWLSNSSYDLNVCCHLDRSAQQIHSCCMYIGTQLKSIGTASGTMVPQNWQDKDTCMRRCISCKKNKNI